MEGAIAEEQLAASLSDQLNELESLKSIFPNHKELVLSDPDIIEKIQQYIDSKTDFVPPNLDFSINLKIEHYQIELNVKLPTLYPKIKPEIFLRVHPQQKREQELSKDLRRYLSDLESGECCIYGIVSWLQENAELYLSNDSFNDKESNIANTQDKYNRIWIYSHHIYSKRKREDILQNAKDYNLTGFCLAGKPGIICIEGSESDCNDWWKIVKSWTWKKIGIKKVETFDCLTWKNEKRFTKFSEQQIDMSAFSKLMEGNGFAVTFQELLNLNN